MTMVAGSSLPPPPVGADFFIGWLCAKTWEYYEASKMFDERYSSRHIVNSDKDKSMYHLGRIGSHYVVMNRPLSQASDESQAPKIAADMKSTFPMIRFILLVGTGGASPSKQNDIRLGDVVFGLEVHPYFQVTSKENVSVESSATKKPPEPLLVATTLLKTGDRSNISLKEVENVNLSNEDPPQRPTRDDLYEIDYPCKGDGCDCEDPQEQKTISDEKRPLPKRPLVKRPLARHRDHIMIHTGIVGSADWLMRSGADRDSYYKRYNIICFDTGTAQVMDIVPCLAIRGISDYSDGHKTDDWKPYASLVAAICAKKLVCQLQREEVERYPFKWESDQLRRYVKGATAQVNHTIGQVNKSNADLEDAERTVNALLERHDVVFNLVNDNLPNMRKDAVKRTIKDFGDKKARELHDLMRSVEELQGELRMSLDDLKRKVHQQGKEVQQHDQGNDRPRGWKELEKKLEFGIDVDEKLSRQFHHALSTMGHCLPPEAGDGKSDSTYKMWRTITDLLHDFKFSVKKIPARMSHMFRSPQHPGRQGKNRATTKEHQNSERLSTTQLPSSPNLMPDNQTAGIRRSGHFPVNQYSEYAASTPSFALSSYQHHQQSIATQSETILPMQSGAHQHNRRPENQLHDSSPRKREHPSGPQRTDFIDPPNMPGRRSSPSLSPADSDHGDLSSQPDTAVSSNSSLQSPDGGKPSLTPVSDSAQAVCR